jgi:hypothetical protein
MNDFVIIFITAWAERRILNQLKFEDIDFYVSCYINRFTIANRNPRMADSYLIYWTQIIFIAVSFYRSLQLQHI